MLLCVDSKSALQAIKDQNPKTRQKLILDIKHIVHQLSRQNIAITFYWIPSHIGIFSNDMVDRAAKNAANNTEDTILSAVPLDLHEYCLQIKKIYKKTTFIN